MRSFADMLLGISDRKRKPSVRPTGKRTDLGAQHSTPLVAIYAACGEENALQHFANWSKSKPGESTTNASVQLDYVHS